VIKGELIPALPTGYTIDQSLRFNDNDSAYLSRTPSSAGNRKTWTLSAWVKRSSEGEHGIIAFNGSYNPYLDIMFGGHAANNAQLNILDWPGGSANFHLVTTQLFRDYSAWYHIIVACDTTQATSSDRVKLYVNGERITAFNTAVYPSQNLDTNANNTTSNGHEIGATTERSTYYDGYLAEVNFIDGQALTPSSFGETDGTYGHWKPIEYTGTYGTNGFYLDFADSADLGNDVSGEGNDWTPTNLAATDVVLDTPTNNFAVWNPLYVKNASGTYSEGNCKYVGSSDGHCAQSSIGITSQDAYAEFRFLSTGQYGIVGLRNDVGDKKYIWTSTGYLYTQSGYTGISTSTYGIGDIIGITVDADGNASLYKNGTFVRTLCAMSHFGGDTVHFMAGGGNNNNGWACNFGQDSSFAGNETAQSNTDDNGYGDFYYSPPTGYLALCTQNLDDPAVIPSEHFHVGLYTGDGVQDRTVTGFGFDLDFAWIKSRSNVGQNVLVNRLSGGTKQLFSNLTNAEQTNIDITNGFVTDGIKLGDNVSGTGSTNQNGYTYAAWGMKANGSGVLNENGTLDSQVSANQDAGFSIVKWTSNGAGAVYTMGHNMGVVPELIIAKGRGDVSHWHVYVDGVTTNYQYLFLNSNAQRGTSGNQIWSTSSTTFGIRQSAVATNGNDCIAYCFHSVEGYSKVGSYTGNGSTNGPMLTFGFQPTFFLVKASSVHGEHWNILDNQRDSLNPNAALLYPSLYNAQASATNGVDFVSNGIKIRGNIGNYNTNGVIYVYYAVASNPFKYTNAR